MKKLLLLALMLFQIVLFAEIVNKIVARINDEIITDFDVKVLMFLQKNKKNYDEILNQLIDENLIIASAKDMDYKIPDEEINYRVDQTIANQRAQYGNDKLFLDALKNEGLTLASLKENYRKQIKNQMLKEKILTDKIKKKISISTEEVENYYNKHRDNFVKTPPIYRIKTIYISAIDKDYMKKIYYRIKRSGKIPREVISKKFDKLFVDLLSKNFQALLNKKTKYTKFIFTEKGLSFYKILKWNSQYPSVIFYTIPYLETKKSKKLAREKIDNFLKRIKEGVAFEQLKVRGDKDMENIFKDGEIKVNEIPEQYKKYFQSKNPNEVFTVETKMGFYLIKIEDIKTMKYFKIGDVFDEIYKKIYEKKYHQLYEELIANAKKENYIKVYK